ncbi:hypothetical protein ScalyP_jg9954 [Parmales sp. scaly parma]|nr:hypothetical protein ScalyP_jg9954 [Parmales sp. scaly parma]
MYERWASFRLEYKLDHILASEISPIVDKNIGYWHGMDNQNRPTCIVIPRRNWPRCEPYMLIRFVMRMLTIGVSQADNPKTNNPSGQLSIIYDRSGMTIRHFDHKLFGIVRKIVDMVQICYAERLGVIYILGANWFFHKMYNLVSLLLTKKTKSKIKLLKQHEELLQYFDQEMLDHVLEFVVVKD